MISSIGKIRVVDTLISVKHSFVRDMFSKTRPIGGTNNTVSCQFVIGLYGIFNVVDWEKQNYFNCRPILSVIVPLNLLKPLSHR